ESAGGSHPGVAQAGGGDVSRRPGSGPAGSGRSAAVGGSGRQRWRQRGSEGRRGGRRVRGSRGEEVAAKAGEGAGSRDATRPRACPGGTPTGCSGGGGGGGGPRAA